MLLRHPLGLAGVGVAQSIVRFSSLLGGYSLSSSLIGGYSLNSSLLGEYLLTSSLIGKYAVVKKDQDFEMVSGDNHDVKFDIDTNVTGFSFKWRLARTKGAADAITKSVAVTEIEITDAGNGLIEVHLVPADTDALAGNYYHELEGVDSGSKKVTLAFGTATIIRDHIT